MPDLLSIETFKKFFYRSSQRCSWKFRKFHRKAPVLEFVFIIFGVALGARKTLLFSIQKQPQEVFCRTDDLKNFTNFTGKHRETLAQMFPREICEIFKNTYIEEHLQTTASFFLLPLLNIADSHYCYTAKRWSRRSTNFKAILGFLTDLEFMPISASWNINQMYYEFPIIFSL